jgi:hypothetical protein
MEKSWKESHLIRRAELVHLCICQARPRVRSPGNRPEYTFARPFWIPLIGLVTEYHEKAADGH